MRLRHIRWLLLVPAFLAAGEDLPSRCIVSGSLPAAQQLGIDFRSGVGDRVSVVIAAGQTSVIAEVAGVETVAKTGNAIPLTPGLPFAIVRDEQQLTLCLASAAVMRAAIPAGPLALVSPSAGRVQRCGEIVFEDDFGRIEELADVWSRRRGNWALDRLGKDDGWSANPSRLRADGSGLTTAGYWFWHDYGVRCAIRPGLQSEAVGLAACIQEDDSGLCFRWRRSDKVDAAHHLAEGAFELVRVAAGDEQILARAPGVLDLGQWYELALFVAAGRAEAYVDGAPLLAAATPAQCLGRVGLWCANADGAVFDDVQVRSVPIGFDLAAADVVRRLFGRRPALVPERMATDSYMQAWSAAQSRQQDEAVLEHTFYSAPVDWRCRSGFWEVTSRWICTPDWSWFGGIGHEHASIWSKSRFTGDQTVDLFAASMMSYGVQLPGMPFGYSRTGDINLTICGDGQTLSSGYTLMVGGFGNTRTCLWRGDRIVAERDDRLYPKVKNQQLHKSWFHLQLQKRDAEILARLNGEAILSFSDPEPLEGGQIAVWTWDAGMMVPRIRIQCAASAGPSTPFSDDAVVVPETVGDAFSAVAERPDEQTIVFTNPQSGGDLSADLGLPAFDAAERGQLVFDYRFPSELRAHLYLEVNGYDFYVAMTAPEEVSEHVVRQAEEVAGRRVSRIGLTGNRRYPQQLARTEIIADNAWHHLALDLATPLRQFFPHAETITVTRAYLGNWCNADYLMCGFGGNPDAMTWAVKGVTLRPRPAPPLSTLPRLAPGSGPVRRSTDPATGELVIGAGAAAFSVVLVDQPLDALRNPELSLTYRASAPLELSLTTQSASAALTGDLTCDGSWHTLTVPLSRLSSAQSLPFIPWIALSGPRRNECSEVELRLRDLSWTTADLASDTAAPTITSRSPQADVATAPGPIVVRLADTGSGIDTAGLVLLLGERRYSLADAELSFAAASGEVTLRPPIFGDGEQPSCTVQAADRAGNEVKEIWHWTVDYALDDEPPPAPYIAYIPGARLQWDDFEVDAHQWQSRRGGLGSRTSAKAATGQFSYEADGFSTFATYTPFDAVQYPLVHFDYCLAPGAAFNWMLDVDDHNWEVRCNSPTNKVEVAGDLAGIVADGRWHRASFDLLEMLGASGETPVVVQLIGTYNRGGTGRWFDNFIIAARHDPAPRFEWSLVADATGIVGYSYVLDREPTTVAPKALMTSERSTEFGALAAGTWYLHVRACDGAGNWGATGHARFEQREAK